MGTMADTAKEEIKAVEMDVEATEVPTEGTKKPGLTLQGSLSFFLCISMPFPYINASNLFSHRYRW